MARILVVYGTTEGHTEKIAKRMGAVLREAGHEAEVHDASELGALDGTYEGVVVGGSVHAGKHQPGVRDFARRYRDLLERVPSAFFSVSLTAAEADEESRRAVEGVVDEFVKETGWQPDRVEPVAGALVYSQYNIFVRHLMKLISNRHGHPTDTSRDYEYTDWDAVEAFAREFSERVRAGSGHEAEGGSARG